VRVHGIRARARACGKAALAYAGVLFMACSPFPFDAITLQPDVL